MTTFRTSTPTSTSRKKSWTKSCRTTKRELRSANMLFAPRTCVSHFGIMRIIGIDPGTRITGYGIIDVEGNRLHHVDNGIIKTRSSDPLPLRLKSIYDGLTVA